MSKEYVRKATFTVSKSKNGTRVFTPVNKRAHTVVRKLGKRARVTVDELRTSVGKGSYVFYQYGTDGTLRRIRL